MISVVIAGVRIYPDAPGHIRRVRRRRGVRPLARAVYAHAIAQSVKEDQHLSRAELAHVARQEASILEAGVPSVVALLLGAVGLLSEEAAVWLAIGLGLAVLAAQGFIFARVERLGRAGMAAVVALNLGFGLLIWLKLLVGHH